MITTLGIVAVFVLLIYLDRLRVLQWRLHKCSVVGMHVAWALWLGGVAYGAFTGGAFDPFDILGVVGAGLWLMVSSATWPKNEPPPSASRNPIGRQPVSDDELRQIYGGRGQS